MRRYCPAKAFLWFRSGAFIGLFGPGVRLLNAAIWENKSAKLQAIDLGHEVAIYALQGAILGAWH